MRIRPAYAAHAVDAWLWKKGLVVPEARLVLRRLLLLAGTTLAAGLALWPLNSGLFWFGATVALCAWNFYGLTIFVQRAIPSGWSKALLFRMILGANGRLLFTGLFLYIVLVRFGAPLPAVLAGVTAPVAFVLLLGLTLGLRRKRTP